MKRLEIDEDESQKEPSKLMKDVEQIGKEKSDDFWRNTTEI
ncbi:MAG: hypothetical protein Ta2E_09610 [Mycoplasmoidaceae bacterium]|nr:MAG: hypothetical protein Ta2E_09610 [Mycoplasmoidaceae bacterium]